MRQIIILALISLLLSGFHNKRQGVFLTFKNGSSETFKSLHAKVRGQDYFFKGLKSGRSTNPITVANTYSYCYAEVITKHDTLVCQPVDYVGETLYTSGKMTMELYIFHEGKERRLSIR